MTPLTGPLYVVVGVLFGAGMSKVLAPTVTATVLRRIGIPAPRASTRALGLGEIAIACLALATGSPAAWLVVALMHAAFTTFVLWALQADEPLGSCGCFGQEDTPPTPGHAAYNAAATAIGFLAALDPVRPADLGLSAVELAIFVMLVALGVALAILSMTALPRTLALVQGGVDPAVREFSVDRSVTGGP